MTLTATTHRHDAEHAEDELTFAYTGLHARLFDVLEAAYAVSGGDEARVTDALADAARSYHLQIASIHRERRDLLADQRDSLVDLGAHSDAISAMESDRKRADDAVEYAIDTALEAADNITESYRRACTLLDADDISFDDYRGRDALGNAILPHHVPSGRPAVKAVTTDDGRSEYVMYQFDGHGPDRALCGCPAARFYSPLCKHTIAHVLSTLN